MTAVIYLCRSNITLLICWLQMPLVSSRKALMFIKWNKVILRFPLKPKLETDNDLSLFVNSLFLIIRIDCFLDCFLRNYFATCRRTASKSFKICSSDLTYSYDVLIKGRGQLSTLFKYLSWQIHLDLQTLSGHC